VFIVYDQIHSIKNTAHDFYKVYFIINFKNFNLLNLLNLPCWCLHLVVAGELEYPNDTESYAAGRVTLDGQVEG